MSNRKTFFSWALFVFTACIKSVLDVSHFRHDGTFDSIFYGRQAFWSHPIWCSVNIMLDAGGVAGAVMVTREAVVSRWRRVGE